MKLINKKILKFSLIWAMLLSLSASTCANAGIFSGITGVFSTGKDLFFSAASYIGKSLTTQDGSVSRLNIKGRTVVAGLFVVVIAKMFLLKHKFNLYGKNSIFSFWSLRRIFKDDDLDKIKKLCLNVKNIDEEYSLGYALIHYACKYNSKKILSWLVNEKHAKIDTEIETFGEGGGRFLDDKSKKVAIEIAIKNKSFDAFKFLADGMDLDYLEKHAKESALRYSNEEALEYLIHDKKIKVSSLDFNATSYHINLSNIITKANEFSAVKNLKLDGSVEDKKNFESIVKVALDKIYYTHSEKEKEKYDLFNEIAFKISSTDEYKFEIIKMIFGSYLYIHQEEELIEYLIKNTIFNTANEKYFEFVLFLLEDPRKQDNDFKMVLLKSVIRSLYISEDFNIKKIELYKKILEKVFVFLLEMNEKCQNKEYVNKTFAILFDILVEKIANNKDLLFWIASNRTFTSNYGDNIDICNDKWSDVIKLLLSIREVRNDIAFFDNILDVLLELGCNKNKKCTKKILEPLLVDWVFSESGEDKDRSALDKKFIHAFAMLRDPGLCRSLLAKIGNNNYLIDSQDYKECIDVLASRARLNFESFKAAIENVRSDDLVGNKVKSIMINPSWLFRMRDEKIVAELGVISVTYRSSFAAQYLIDRKMCNVNQQLDDSGKMVHFAVISGDLDLLKYLVGNGAELVDSSLLLLAVGEISDKGFFDRRLEPERVEIFKYLVDNGEYIELPSIDYNKKYLEDQKYASSFNFNEYACSHNLQKINKNSQYLNLKIKSLIDDLKKDKDKNILSKEIDIIEKIFLQFPLLKYTEVALSLDRFFGIPDLAFCYNNQKEMELKFDYIYKNYLAARGRYVAVENKEDFINEIKSLIGNLKKDISNGASKGLLLKINEIKQIFLEEEMSLSDEEMPLHLKKFFIPDLVWLYKNQKEAVLKLCDIKKMYKKIKFDYTFVNDPKFRQAVELALKEDITDKNGISIFAAVAIYGDYNDYLSYIFETKGDLYCSHELFRKWHKAKIIKKDLSLKKDNLENYEIEELKGSIKDFSNILDHLDNNKINPRLFRNIASTELVKSFLNKEITVKDQEKRGVHTFIVEALVAKIIGFSGTKDFGNKVLGDKVTDQECIRLRNWL